MRAWLSLALVAALLLAGCSSGGGGGPVPSGDPTTGSLRGLVVDQAIAPIADALVTLSGGANQTTNARGEFNFTGLQPGDYVVTVTKLGYKGAQSSATVVAGAIDPDPVKLLLERLSVATPYLDHYKLEGFYSCTFALFFVTDSCEFGYRTAWDEANSTGNQPPAPRNLQEFRNTQYIDISEDTFTIIQEGFWDDESVKMFWIMLDETPIDNGCDCSDSYANRIGEGGHLLSRLERFAPDGSPNGNFTTDYSDPIGEFPLGKTVASRGFIPFQKDPVCGSFTNPSTCGQNMDPNTWASTAVNFQFVVITTLFHNYAPDPDWTFETRETFPVG